MKRVLIPFRHADKVRPYQQAVEQASLEPVPADVSQPMSLRDFAGLLLMGGTDVNPSRYGETAQPETEQPDDARDAAELELIHEAIESDRPILAICRGLQILNVYHRGTLIQHLPSFARHDVNTEDKAAHAHEVTLEPESNLARVTDAVILKVNSRHHQAVKDVGDRLIVSARDHDDHGLIEGLERTGRTFVVAVQWHPEDQVRGDTEQMKLFLGFARACS